jgi:RsiW-degrading membrane proteinase PrsW (M82 family)
VQARSGTVARTEILLVVGLCAFVAVAWAAERVLGLSAPVHLARFGPLPSLALAVVPALLWLGYFYLQDRAEPEPKMYVFGVYVLGAFVAVPLAAFFQHVLPSEAPVWSGARLSPSRVLFAIFPAGIAQELAKYLVVRYSVYLTDEFDEPMDGIIYMTAAGIGFATAQNYQYLAGLEHTVFLGAGAVNCVVTTLAHGCIAGVLGYALGVARFTAAPGRRAGMLIVALVIAAVLNGLFDLLEELVEVNGMTVEPWRGVAFAAVFAGCVFAATYVLMRRHLASSPHAKGAA